MKTITWCFLLALLLAVQSAQICLCQNDKSSLGSWPSFKPDLKITAADYPANSQEANVWDIKTDSNGNLLFLDQRGCKVWRFSQEGKYIETFDIVDDDHNKPQYPVKLIVDSKDNMFVLDGYTKSIFALSNRGKFIRRFSVNVIYPEPHLFNGVIGPEDQLIIGGYLNGKIVHLFDANGNLLRSLGENVSREQARAGESCTQAMYFSNGFLYYTLMTRYEIRKLDISNNKTVASYIPQGIPWGEFTVFLSLILSPEGGIFTFRRTGSEEFVDRFAKDGLYVGTVPGNFQGATIDRQGKLWCLEYGKSTEIFRCDLTVNNR